MRLLVAALLGAVVMFFWGFVSHMVLPVGEMGVRAAANEEAFLAAAKEHLGGGEGVYLVPGLMGADMQDEAKVKAYSAKAVANPNVLVVYQPVGSDGMQMGDNLGKEFATNFLCAVIVAYVLSLGAFGFVRRVQLAALMGVFAWLAINVPYWNWYRFPLDFTLGSLIQQVVGWVLAGAAIAGWLGRGERTG
jgi:hypothetical protein